MARKFKQNDDIDKINYSLTLTHRDIHLLLLLITTSKSLNYVPIVKKLEEANQIE